MERKPAKPAGVAVTAERNLAIDAMKFTAAAAIVLLHTANVSRGVHPEALAPALIVPVTYAGLYFFFLVSGYFHGALGGRDAAWMRRRLIRLGVPYAAWSIIYLVWKEGPPLLMGAELQWPDPIRLVFFAGAHDVLWSLPMLLYSAIIAQFVVRTALHRRIAIAACAVLMALIYMALPEAQWPADSLVFFLLSPRWVLLYLLGMEIRDVRLPTTTHALNVVVGVCVAVLIAIGFTRSSIQGPVGAVISTILTASTLIVATRSNAGRIVERLSWGGRYLLGIYVSHYLWLELFVLLANPATMSAATWLMLGWSFSFGLALATSVILERIPGLRLTVT